MVGTGTTTIQSSGSTSPRRSAAWRHGPLGQDRVDESGINAGFYERATAAEICDYYGRVLDEYLLPSGRVRFFAMHDHLGLDADGHLLRSRVTGQTTTVRVRRKL